MQCISQYIPKSPIIISVIAAGAYTLVFFALRVRNRKWKLALANPLKSLISPSHLFPLICLWTKQVVTWTTSSKIPHKTLNWKGFFFFFWQHKLKASYRMIIWTLWRKCPSNCCEIPKKCHELRQGTHLQSQEKLEITNPRRKGQSWNEPKTPIFQMN
jgi:hypothetical protein